MQDLITDLFDCTHTGNVTPYTILCLLILIWAVFPKRDYTASLPLRLALTGTLTGIYSILWVYGDEEVLALTAMAVALPSLLGGLLLGLCKEKVTFRFLVLGLYLVLTLLFAYILYSEPFIMS